MNTACINRISKELKMLSLEPPEGISVWVVGSEVTQLEASIKGPKGTSYEDGQFKLTIQIPNRYPFEPPKIKFLTKIYHPNIDSSGRICLDTLKLPPMGGWKPVISLGSILQMIRLLLEEPNPHDGLMAGISQEYIQNRRQFEKKAKETTLKYAVDSQSLKVVKNFNKELKNRENSEFSNINNQRKRKQPISIENKAKTVGKEKEKEKLKEKKKYTNNTNNFDSDDSDDDSDDSDDSNEDNVEKNKKSTINKIDSNIMKRKRINSEIILIDEDKN
ncbi:ubiquitin-conjugating enzyme e2 t [Anaeramoeba flamelloides]|uniref:E2 ubiquitin-conjugating enzyme n=1 Tax=Anaeramoeba flamelloides TaxID=1746091 RepID=A0AAV7ZL29_9EUKA|nr:ubiquitin-conjugating enzyme e2 t [Anaeramoeba flamelloides]